MVFLFALLVLILTFVDGKIYSATNSEVQAEFFRPDVKQILSRDELVAFVSRAVRTREDEAIYRSAALVRRFS